MKLLKKSRRPEREEVTGGHKRKERNWILEYQWKSEKDWNTYPSYAFGKKPYNVEWVPAWGRYIDSNHAIEMIKKDYRTRASWVTNRYQGKNWRVRNRKTEEIIPIEL